MAEIILLFVMYVAVGADAQSRLPRVILPAISRRIRNHRSAEPSLFVAEFCAAIANINTRIINAISTMLIQQRVREVVVGRGVIMEQT